MGERYGLILVLIIITFAVMEASPEGIQIHVVAIVLQGIMLVAALRVSRVRRSFLILAILLFVVAVTASIIATLSGREQSLILTTIIGAILLAAIIAAFLLSIPRHFTVVDMQTIYGALCVYLLVGMLFSYVYAVVGILLPPFFTTVQNASIKDYLYFSFITLTTVGYGDLVAKGDLPRTLVVVEAVLGQLYLVTVVALLVGNYGKRPTRKEG